MLVGGVVEENGEEEEGELDGYGLGKLKGCKCGSCYKEGGIVGGGEMVEYKEIVGDGG